MKKQKLTLDQLTVNSFTTSNQEARIVGGSCDCSITTVPERVCIMACSNPCTHIQC